MSTLRDETLSKEDQLRYPTGADADHALWSANHRVVTQEQLDQVLDIVSAMAGAPSGGDEAVQEAVKAIGASSEDKQLAPQAQAIVISTILDVFGNVVCQFSPGGPAGVHSLLVTSGLVGSPVGLTAIPQIGGDENVDLDLNGWGTGKVTVGGEPVLNASPSDAPDTTLVVDANAKAVLDQIISDLVLAGLYNAP